MAVTPSKQINWIFLKKIVSCTVVISLETEFFVCLRKLLFFLANIILLEFVLKLLHFYRMQGQFSGGNYEKDKHH